ncbi:hypothetical protein HDE_04462 [Halotydeus destructor]|nr:hypothetical protein HDE_04462 [Halotydeus destructor]
MVDNVSDLEGEPEPDSAASAMKSVVDGIKEVRLDLQQKLNDPIVEIREETEVREERMKILQKKAEVQLYKLLRNDSSGYDYHWVKGACLLMTLLIVGFIIFVVPNFID